MLDTISIKKSRKISRFSVCFWTPCICSNVLRLARDGKAAQDEHFERFTVTETQKITEIQNFKNFGWNVQKNI